MAEKRKDDSTDPQNWRRADRIFEIEGMWFFYTREGAIEGPFVSETGAHHRISVYKQIVMPDISFPTGQAIANLLEI